MSPSLRTGLLSLLAAAAGNALAQSPTQTFTYSGLYDFVCVSGGQGCLASMSPYALMQGADGNFYGTNAGGVVIGDVGAVYKLTPPKTLTSLYNFCVGRGTACTDGAGPAAGVIQGSDGNLYGTTSSGGVLNTAVCTEFNSYGCGTVFKLTPSGALTTLHTFCAKGGTCSDGYDPSTSLVEGLDGNFYGTTPSGGCAGTIETCGTFFRVTPSGTFATLYTFCNQTNCSDGYHPGSILLGTDGNFYGITAYSNLTATDGGVVFQLTPAGVYTVLYAFCSRIAHSFCADGSLPTALVQAPDGSFFGLTQFGGSANAGTAFHLTASSQAGTPGQLTTLYSFCSQGLSSCPESGEPDHLTLASDGNLYGTTFSTPGTFDANGTLFQLTPSGTLNVLYTFCAATDCSDGDVPTSIIQGTDGNLYGTAQDGGFSENVGTGCPSTFGGCGVIFKVTVSPPEMFLTPGTLANGATYVSGGLVPGSWAQVKGTALADTTRIWGGSDFTGLGNNLPTNLNGVQVKVNNIAAAVYYISPGQISFQVPSGVSGNATVEVINNGVVSNTLTASASNSAPAIFPVIENGVNYPAGVFLDSDYVGDPSINPAFRNAKPGDIIQLYATGLLATPAGVLITPQILNGVTVTIGTTVIPADSVTLVAVGEFQINFTIPQSFASQAAALYPISIQASGVSSPTTINTTPPAQIVIPIQP
jgi:uncharacterized protein (TIGR03437 family)